VTRLSSQQNYAAELDWVKQSKGIGGFNSFHWQLFLTHVKCLFSSHQCHSLLAVKVQVHFV